VRITQCYLPDKEFHILFRLSACSNRRALRHVLKGTLETPALEATRSSLVHKQGLENFPELASQLFNFHVTAADENQVISFTSVITSHKSNLFAKTAITSAKENIFF
jgi:hypothetical protein